MNQNNLLETAEKIGRLIEAARADVAQGRTVDLRPIESHVSDIYGQVSKDSELAGHDAGRRLADRLETLLGELDRLENDLSARKRSAAGA